MLDRLTTPGGMTRRHFLGHLATSALALPALQLVATLRANAQAVRKANKSCILLWMGGGPSHLDTWDLKPGSDNGGEFRPIATTAPGVQICEHLPTVAKQMHHLNLVRTLNSREGNHDRGTYVLHTGYTPNPTVVHPSFGAVCSYELGPKLGSDFSLPHFVSINTDSLGAGFLGMANAPFAVQNPNAPIANMQPPKGVNDLRMRRRLEMWNAFETSFGRQDRGGAAKDHYDVYLKTVRMMNSELTNAFKVTDADKQRYGKGSFGAGCAMARNLVAAGVTFVEVGLGGWDNHNDIFNTLRDNKLPELDQAMGNLVADLAAGGLLENTLIVWMGDFGRTPKINQNAGRDHWPRGWSVVLGGGGLKGGQVVGQTDKDGVDIVDREVQVMDLIATMTRAMGIDLATQYTTPRGRPIKVVDGGQPIAELF